ncbi:MAG: tetratricopeptide repeat protein [Pyrinomonadaceae bacterium]|nr:tetratricopeptide repeat protein [Pyrinomonadaceae bacterium]
MSRTLLVFIFICLLQFGCDSQAAKNRNANIVENYNRAVNKPGGNANDANVNQANANAEKANEEVPTFENAAEALARGNVYFDTNRVKQAINAYKQAIQFDPELAEAHFKMGVMYALIEREEDEKPILPVEEESTTKKKKKKPEKRASEKHFENAIKAYKKIVAKDRKNDSAYFNLGRAYNKLNEDQDAEKALRKATKLKPENTVYKTELGATLIKLARYEQAVRVLEQAKKLDDANSRAEDLLVEARSGRKRVNYGKDKKKR